MTKRYVVHLLPEERETLNSVIRERKSAAWKVQRSHALLMCDAGPGGPAWPDSKIAAAFGCTTRSLESWRKRAVEEGPLPLLERKPEDSPRVTPKLQGDHQARLTQLACSAPPPGRSRWTLKLLAKRLVELEIVESISAETVRRTLKKRNEALAEENVVHSSAPECRLRQPNGAGTGGLSSASRHSFPGREHG